MMLVRPVTTPPASSTHLDDFQQAGAAGDDVLGDDHLFALFQGEAAPDHHHAVLAFGEDEAAAQRPGHLVADQDAAHGRTDHQVVGRVGEEVAHGGAQFAGQVGKLQDPRALEVGVAVQAAAQQEMALCRAPSSSIRARTLSSVMVGSSAALGRMASGHFGGDGRQGRGRIGCLGDGSADHQEIRAGRHGLTGGGDPVLVVRAGAGGPDARGDDQRSGPDGRAQAGQVGGRTDQAVAAAVPGQPGQPFDPVLQRSSDEGLTSSISAATGWSGR